MLRKSQVPAALQEPVGDCNTPAQKAKAAVTLTKRELKAFPKHLEDTRTGRRSLANGLSPSERSVHETSHQWLRHCQAIFIECGLDK